MHQATLPHHPHHQVKGSRVDLLEWEISGYAAPAPSYAAPSGG